MVASRPRLRTCVGPTLFEPSSSPTAAAGPACCYACVCHTRAVAAGHWSQLVGGSTSTKRVGGPQIEGGRRSQCTVTQFKPTSEQQAQAVVVDVAEGRSVAPPMGCRHHRQLSTHAHRPWAIVRLAHRLSRGPDLADEGAEVLAPAKVRSRAEVTCRWRAQRGAGFLTCGCDEIHRAYRSCDSMWLCHPSRSPPTAPRCGSSGRVGR